MPSHCPMTKNKLVKSMPKCCSTNVKLKLLLRPNIELRISLACASLAWVYYDSWRAYIPFCPHETRPNQCTWHFQWFGATKNENSLLSADLPSCIWCVSPHAHLLGSKSSPHALLHFPPRHAQWNMFMNSLFDGACESRNDPDEPLVNAWAMLTKIPSPLQV